MKNLSDIVDDIHKNGSTGATKDQIATIAKATVAGISTGLKSDGEVRIDKLGTFTSVERPERMGRNPATGEQALIKASVAVKFKASKTLKDAVA